MPAPAGDCEPSCVGVYCRARRRLSGTTPSITTPAARGPVEAMVTNLVSRGMAGYTSNTSCTAMSAKAAGAPAGARSWKATCRPCGGHCAVGGEPRVPGVQGKGACGTPTVCEMASKPLGLKAMPSALRLR